MRRTTSARNPSAGLNRIRFSGFGQDAYLSQTNSGSPLRAGVGLDQILDGGN
jgi:hypothetical protein